MSSDEKFWLYKPKEGRPFAVSPLCVKVLPELDAYVRSKSDPSSWLRQAITEAAEREGFDTGSDRAKSSTLGETL
jgi:hypothetical protein